jgi:glutaredoxin
MEICKPIDEGYTIYSKSGCINCTRIKQFLKQKQIFFLEVQCDELLLKDKEEFLLIISEMAEKECTTFPMIFHNGEFIGGYNEVKTNIEKSEVQFE